MRKVVSIALILTMLMLIVMFNVSSPNKISKGNSQANINSPVKSFLLDDMELMYIGAVRWACIGLSALGITASVAGMLLAAPTGGASFWISFLGYNISKAALIECFL